MSGKLKNIVGNEYITTEGFKLKVIEYNGWYNSTVLLEDGNILYNINLGNLQKGTVKNPFLKTAYGVGYFGQGKFNGAKETIKYYTCWKAMLQRCYDLKYQEKQPTYKGCTVDERWHNFQVFAEWYENNYKEGFALDKDFLVKGNKVYSPEMCRFLPREINGILSKKDKVSNLPTGIKIRKNGKFQAVISIDKVRFSLGTFFTIEEAFQAYKTAKEKRIKELADKWKDQIHNDIYQALYNYQVEITD